MSKQDVIDFLKILKEAQEQRFANEKITSVARPTINWQWFIDAVEEANL